MPNARLQRTREAYNRPVTLEEIIRALPPLVTYTTRIETDANGYSYQVKTPLPFTPFQRTGDETI